MAKKKVMLTLSENILQVLEQLATAKGISRSAVVSIALTEYEKKELKEIGGRSEA